jgi:molybdenum cofactor synthesis domain-containing protein
VDWHLLSKTTFWVDGVDLNDADLRLLACRVGDALGLQDHEIAVVDVRVGTIAFDVLRETVRPEWIIAKEDEVIEALRSTEGVAVRVDACVHSDGVLGLISLPKSAASSVLEDAQRVGQEVRAKLVCRAVVFASGEELLAGAVRDLNSGPIIEALEADGFEAVYGGILRDDVNAAASAVEAAIGRGYGLVVTTGGVGAEDKDHAREVIARFDPSACAAPVLAFEVDNRRHHRDGVYIIVGECGAVRMVALPGPTVEARLACGRMIEGLGRGMDKRELAEHVADGLREHWLSSRNGADKR